MNLPMKTVIGYMDRTDFDHELGHASDGNKVYPSVEALKRDRSCVDECGIVMVAVTFVAVIEEGTM